MKTKMNTLPKEIPFVGQHVTEFHYTDRDAWEVVEIISPRRIKIRELDAECIRKPQEFYPGGFCGHYADNHAQEYRLSSNPNNKTKVLSWRAKAMRWAEVGQQTRYSKFGLHKKGETANFFYDYNF